MTRVLVLNSGSSSIKYRLFGVDGPDGAPQPLTGGLIERIGEPGGPVSHDEALRAEAARLGLESADLVAIGHRTVHGGARFTEPTLITDEVIAAMTELTPLAPLHNPPNLAGIRVTHALRPEVPQVAVFDTAFHSTIPPAASTYAIDTELAARLGIRRYGFHGTSHAYVSRRTAALLDRRLETVNTITLHLGNGASACAVRGGVSVETSMGLTPLEGLVMGTRSGDIDPAIVFHLHRHGGLSLDEIDAQLNRRGGMRGLCGDNDLRGVEERMLNGEPAATRALEVYVHRLRKYLGAYAVTLGRLDAVTFTGGVGEHSPIVRAAVTEHTEILGIRLDPARNEARERGARIISADDSAVAVCVIPTDEELEIATQTLATI
jgi:acetate kinase